MITLPLPTDGTAEDGARVARWLEHWLEYSRCAKDNRSAIEAMDDRLGVKPHYSSDTLIEIAMTAEAIVELESEAEYMAETERYRLERGAA